MIVLVRNKDGAVFGYHPELAKRTTEFRVMSDDDAARLPQLAPPVPQFETVQLQQESVPKLSLVRSVNLPAASVDQPLVAASVAQALVPETVAQALVPETVAQALSPNGVETPIAAPEVPLWRKLKNKKQLERHVAVHFPGTEFPANADFDACMAFVAGLYKVQV